MTLEDAVESLASDKGNTSRWVGVYIGTLAGLLAICNVGGGNASKDAARANIEASDTWAFYQAKHGRFVALDLAADELELALEAKAEPSADLTRHFRERIDGYRQHAQTLKSDPVSQEGMKELHARAKRLEDEREIALRRDPYFDWSQAILQIGIVLASVHLIIGARWVLRLSAVLGALGLLLLLNGFFLIWRVPLLG